MLTSTPTVHIGAKKEEVAKFVIMPGDPLRAKWIAYENLTNVKEVNNIRGMLMYTGFYNNMEITVAASGMGMASIGIYAFELYKFYDVNCIIRVGTCGSYSKDLNLYDVINVDSSYSESTFAKVAFNIQNDTIDSDKQLFEKLNQAAAVYKKTTAFNFQSGLIHSSDVFYHANHNYWKNIHDTKNCLAVEMESFSLFTIAKALKKQAGCLLTVSDSLVTGEKTSAAERQEKMKIMIKIALTALSTMKE